MKHRKEFQMLKQVAVRGIEPLQTGLKSVDLPLVDTAPHCGASGGIRTRKAIPASRLVGGRVYQFHHTGVIRKVEAGGFGPPILRCQTLVLSQFNYAPTKRRPTQSSGASLRNLHLLFPRFSNTLRLLFIVAHSVLRFFACAPYTGRFLSISFPCRGFFDSCSIRITASLIDRRPVFSNGFLSCCINGIFSCPSASDCWLGSFSVSNLYNSLYRVTLLLAASRTGSNFLTSCSFSFIFLSKCSESFIYITPLLVVILMYNLPHCSITWTAVKIFDPSL